MTQPYNIDFLDDRKSVVSLVDRMVQDFALKVTNVARVSYDSSKSEFTDKDKKLTKFLWNNDHTSPFRHSYYTFQVKLPLSIARQMTKYQVGSTFRMVEANGEEVFIDEFDIFYDTDKGCSWNEVSGRYTQTSIEFYYPKELRSNPGHGNKQSSGEYVNPKDKYDMGHLYPEEISEYMEDSCQKALYLYNRMVDNGVAKEIARGILPQNIYTKVTWTISLQAVLHFLRQRLESHAQWEIQQLAKGIYELVKPDLDKLGITLEDLCETSA